MPIFSYFMVVGSVLTALLLWFGTAREPIGPALTLSQTVGIPRFKPEPEAEHARVTAVNFAAPHVRLEIKTVNTGETPPRQKVTTHYANKKRLSQFAEFPNANLSIH
jgi:hypothetical protein